MNALLSEKQLAALDSCYLMLGNKFCFGSKKTLIAVGYDGPLGAKVMALMRKEGDVLFWETGIVRCMRAVETASKKWRDDRTYLMHVVDGGYAFKAWMAPAERASGKPRRLLMELVDENLTHSESNGSLMA